MHQQIYTVQQSHILFHENYLKVSFVIYIARATINAKVLFVHTHTHAHTPNDGLSIPRIKCLVSHQGNMHQVREYTSSSSLNTTRNAGNNSLAR